jgi:hypothetical protein
MLNHIIIPRKHGLILQRNNHKNDTGKQAVGILLDKAVYRKPHRRKTDVLTHDLIDHVSLYNKI